MTVKAELGRDTDGADADVVDWYTKTKIGIMTM